MACGRTFPVCEYLEEIDRETWDLIAARPCDRA